MVQAGGPAVVVALGAGALVGGLAGALIVSSLGAFGPSSEPLAARVAGPEPIEPENGRDSERLELLLGTLIEEVQSLRTSLGPGRQSADTALTDGSGDLIAALEALTAAVRRASSGSGGAGSLGSGLTTIDFPQGAARIDILLERKSVQDEHQRVRPYLLWNYQQVLDHFGPPSAIWPNDKWMYEDPMTGAQVELHFQHGLLINIY
jgi:hypothetical protein